MKKKKSWADKRFTGEWGKTLENYIHRKADKVPKGFLQEQKLLKKWDYTEQSEAIEQRSWRTWFEMECLSKNTSELWMDRVGASL